MTGCIVLPRAGVFSGDKLMEMGFADRQQGFLSAPPCDRTRQHIRILPEKAQVHRSGYLVVEIAGLLRARERRLEVAQPQPAWPRRQEQRERNMQNISLKKPGASPQGPRVAIRQRPRCFFAASRLPERTLSTQPANIASHCEVLPWLRAASSAELHTSDRHLC